MVLDEFKSTLSAPQTCFATHRPHQMPLFGGVRAFLPRLRQPFRPVFLVFPVKRATPFLAGILPGNIRTATAAGNPRIVVRPVVHLSCPRLAVKKPDIDKRTNERILLAGPVGGNLDVLVGHAD